jgi:hypothetical protein
MKKRTSTTLGKTILASTVALVIGLSTQSAEASHETGWAVSLGGHLTLMPAYISVAYYAAHSEVQMPLGWVVPNLALSIHGASIGIVGMMLSIESGSSTFGSGELPPFGIEGSVIVLATSTATGIASVLQTMRITDSQTVKKSASSMPFVLLPSVTTTRETGTTVSLMAVGTF